MCKGPEVRYHDVQGLSVRLSDNEAPPYTEERLLLNSAVHRSRHRAATGTGWAASLSSILLNSQTARCLNLGLKCLPPPSLQGHFYACSVGGLGSLCWNAATGYMNCTPAKHTYLKAARKQTIGVCADLCKIVKL